MFEAFIFYHLLLNGEVSVARAICGGVSLVRQAILLLEREALTHLVLRGNNLVEGLDPVRRIGG